MTPRLLFLDFETYYDDVYSLRKMTPAQYILDPRFELIMCAVKEGLDGRPYVVDGPDFGCWIHEHDPRNTVAVTHNALFDMCVLAWHCGVVPGKMIDTLGLSRARLGHKLRSHSLARVGEFLGAPQPKGYTVAHVKGMPRAEIKDRGLWAEYCKYSMVDVEICAHIFRKLVAGFPLEELDVMDMVLRCAVEPKFQVDEKMLKDFLDVTQEHKAKLLKDSGAEKPELMSALKFAALLETHGVDVEMKVSLKTGKSLPALAKTDEFMASLLEHENPDVAALANARLGFKSTLEETRAQRLLDIARLPWSHYRDGNPRLWLGCAPPVGGAMPIPLRYAGAHTHRLSGDWGMNMQNLPREWLDPRTKQKEKSKLRRALIAPPGYRVVAGDLSQIEARLTAWICHADGLVQQFADNLDPYSRMASSIFGFPVDRKKFKVEHFVYGFVGKTAILGLGYGCGVDRFYDMVQKSARLFGIDLSTINFDRALADCAVRTYRCEHHQIPACWQVLDNVLANAWMGTSGPYRFGPVTIRHGEVLLPNGMSLYYDNPRRVDGEFYYEFGGMTYKIYGAKLLENIVQALARIVVMQAAVRLRDRGMRFVLQAHDELVFLLLETFVEVGKTAILEEMTRRPVWAPNLPLGAEVQDGLSYGDAK